MNAFLHTVIRKKFYLILALVLVSTVVSAQITTDTSAVAMLPKDTLPPPPKVKDTTTRQHSPRVAAIRSAIFPGLGQIYNKKYWKLPIVYGAMGISGGIFFFNLKNYRETRFAYKTKYNMRVFRTAADTADFAKVKDHLKPLSEESLRFYRDQYRRDIDYSAIFFLVMWGLNVVDATVDAHLKTFDVSPDLSFRIKPGYSELAGTNGISLVLTFR